MPGFKRYKDREDVYCVRLKSQKITESDVADLWMLMCGEEAIKAFLSKCMKDEWGYRIPALQEQFKPK
jgi:hypothetical protein